MKRIIVFGAAGGTGREVVKQALAGGFMVTAFVRTLSAFDMQHEYLTVLKSDVLNRTTFENDMAGAHAVISCLGARSGEVPVTVYSNGISNIIHAMQNKHVTRLITISAGALYTNKSMGFFIRALTSLILQRVFREMYADMRTMEFLVEQSNLDWTIVRPPMLTNKGLTMKYRTAIDDHVHTPWSISRADLAHFIMSMVDDSRTFKTKAEISY